MSWRGLVKRVMSPSSAINVAAATSAMPRSACRAPHHRRQRPVRQRRFDMRFQTIAPCRRRLDGSDAIFQHDVMRRLLEPQSGQPATVHQRPGRPVVVMAMTQQETGELLTRLAQGAHRRQTRTDQIADRLMRLIRNPHRRQFTGTMQLGEIDRIAPVGLDPISGLARDQRRSNDNATVPGRASTAAESP